MAFASMTGFAESAGAHEDLRFRWEAKSVNGRGLDLRLRTPPGFDGLEPPARLLAAERFRRGSFQITLTVENQEGPRGLRVDPVALASAVRLAREVAAETGLAPARIDGLLALKGVIVQEDSGVRIVTPGSWGATMLVTTMLVTTMLVTTMLVTTIHIATIHISHQCGGGNVVLFSQCISQHQSRIFRTVVHAFSGDLV